MSRRPIAQINIDALLHNFSHIQHLAPQSRILAVLKANAYGHGLLAVAGQLKAAGAFGDFGLLAVAKIGNSPTEGSEETCSSLASASPTGEM